MGTELVGLDSILSKYHASEEQMPLGSTLGADRPAAAQEPKMGYLRNVQRKRRNDSNRVSRRSRTLTYREPQTGWISVSRICDALTTLDLELGLFAGTIDQSPFSRSWDDR